ncbi:nucleotide exchange factor GrpE [Candidatus Roizmanbacteria bacterium CG_4_10_14_0_8_um_filter_33_9]|uniref:Protein GrpE n=1 Tax=Candidatus Roizmanbacteria bacterium CG_4_10_14_0_8_um_filter_33_9 TaxID=1974826 RepID=A0A2M7QJP0_9BACT|nr:MAG: nucleotide exchange factor GrpE [Candidatus Roizmanbacteria bacterium CG_4_10_14_0_8_um_filter_33_9]
MDNTKAKKQQVMSQTNNQDIKEEVNLQHKLEIERLQKEVLDYKTKFLRALADYQNLEKRMLDEKTKLIQTANKEFILKLLFFLDNLNRAELFIKDANLKMIKQSFEKLLENEGLKEIVVLNKPFDPYTSEVIDLVEGEKENEVIEVLRKGYMLSDQLLRSAQVKVSKKIEKKAN